MLSSVPGALDAMQHILLTNSGESGGGGQLSAASMRSGPPKLALIYQALVAW